MSCRAWDHRTRGGGGSDTSARAQHHSQCACEQRRTLCHSPRPCGPNARRDGAYVVDAHEGSEAPQARFERSRDGNIALVGVVAEGATLHACDSGACAVPEDLERAPGLRWREGSVSMSMAYGGTAAGRPRGVSDRESAPRWASQRRVAHLQVGAHGGVSCDDDADVKLVCDRGVTVGEGLMQPLTPRYRQRACTRSAAFAHAPARRTQGKRVRRPLCVRP